MSGPEHAPAAALTEPTRRLFFALWPDPALTASLVAAVAGRVPAGLGKPQRPEQLHATVEFLGSVVESRLPGVQAAGRSAAAGATPCAAVLDTLEHWRRARVLCLTASAVPAALASLVQDLRARLRERGFEPENREFRLHVTLARKLRHPPQLVTVAPIHWPVRELVLVQSVATRQGSRYERLASWPLGVATAGAGPGSRHEPGPREIAG
jgi:2'-5' RNA ligase